jgi:hypothetical protein
MNSGMVPSRPIIQFASVDIAFSNGIIYTTDRAMSLGWIMHGQEECIVGLARMAIIDLWHLSINIDQLDRLHIEVGCVWVKLPADIVADHLILPRRGFATRGCERILTMGRKEPKLTYSSQ